MPEKMNETPRPGWGLIATVKIVLAIVVMVIAGGAILLVLDLLTLDTFKVLALKTALVGGVSLVAGIILGLLARTRH
ncbi:MAG: hypothetical protein DSZ00_04590 [Gammaproteobacteria bacterium]|nr:MAG: hypothetical protein DSZ00_04590 [Gammaproteobacteria bacterium]RTZ76563.1 MAG: hypothetical protein DSZ02_00940 [Gammaproteobacteria bacterium]